MSRRLARAAREEHPDVTFAKKLLAAGPDGSAVLPIGDVNEKGAIDPARSA